MKSKFFLLLLLRLNERKILSFYNSSNQCRKIKRALEMENFNPFSFSLTPTRLVWLLFAANAKVI
jgi:hypothetical protein